MLEFCLAATRSVKNQIQHIAPSATELRTTAVSERVALAARANCTTPIVKEITMKKTTLLTSTLAVALLLFAGYTLAADQVQDQEQIYGSQLMTQQERIEQRDKMRAAKTAEEREQIRKEHHERMRERAKERGVALPDEPLARGGGRGSGSGMGSGGGGMGSGGGGMGLGGGGRGR